jgi:uncharacterized pyridoxamine 5'-phosphate oxidase family protein
MKELIAFFNANPNGAFATLESGKPRVRPWQFQFEENGKFFFCTNNKKDVYAQLAKDPNAEFTSFTKEMASGRISGKVVFTRDNALKQKVLDKNQMLKTFYSSGDNPAFEVFYFEHGEGILFDLSGNPPRKIIF